MWTCTTQRSISSELVITGLSIPDTTSLKGAVYAALKILDGGLHDRDILHVRKMRLKPSLEPLNQSSFATHAEEPPTTASQSTSDDAGSKVTPLSEEPPTTSSLSTSSVAGSRVTPLIVTLSSHALAQSLLSAKIKMGKMHTSQLSTDLLVQANANPPLPHSLININELLPTELYRLRISARAEAKKRGFVTYVRNGKIYIKKKKEDHAIIISTVEELKPFLA